MRDTPERDLAVADELAHMADARIAELLKERQVLRAELRTQAQLHHACGPHAPHFVTFEECKRGSCVRAREALGDKQ